MRRFSLPHDDRVEGINHLSSGLPKINFYASASKFYVCVPFGAPYKLLTTHCITILGYTRNSKQYQLSKHLINDTSTVVIVDQYFATSPASLRIARLFTFCDRAHIGSWELTHSPFNDGIASVFTAAYV